MSISLSGLGSGTDWSSLIDQLTAVERQPVTKLTTDKTNASAQLSTVGDLLTKLGALATKASSTATATTLWTMSAATSDATQIKATATDGGAAGVYALRVTQLARGETQQSQTFATGSPGLGGTVAIGAGGGTPVNVAIGASDSLSDIAARISQTVPGVSATALYDGTSYRLVMVAQGTGATAGAISVTDGGNLLGMSVAQGARDASVTVNGVTATGPSNHLTGVVPGVALDLAAPTAAGAPDVQITVAKNDESIKQRVRDLVSAYNSVASMLATQQTYSGARRGTDSLFGDPAIASLQDGLGGAIASAVAHGSGTISARGIGVTLGTNGVLTLDETKLSAMLASDPSAVTDLLSGPNGLGQKLSSFVARFTTVDGPLVARQASLRDRMKRDDDQITRVNDRADKVQERLRRQFAALDSIMTASNSQSAYLTRLTNQSDK